MDGYHCTERKRMPVALKGESGTSETMFTILFDNFAGRSGRLP